MGDIVDLQQFREESEPHLCGHLRCMNCQHEWQGVVPVKTMTNSAPECPQCHTFQGAFINAPLRNHGVVWACACGNDLFRVTPVDHGGWQLYCGHCGKIAEPG